MGNMCSMYLIFLICVIVVGFLVLYSWVLNCLQFMMVVLLRNLVVSGWIYVSYMCYKVYKEV